MPNKNYGQLRYGNSDGELRFGFIDKLENKHAFLVRSGSSPSHYFSMVSSPGGDAKTNSHINDGTILKCPGALQIDAGKKLFEIMQNSVRHCNTPKKFSHVKKLYY